MKSSNSVEKWPRSTLRKFENPFAPSHVSVMFRRTRAVPKSFCLTQIFPLLFWAPCCPKIRLANMCSQNQPLTIGSPYFWIIKMTTPFRVGVSRTPALAQITTVAAFTFHQSHCFLLTKLFIRENRKRLNKHVSAAHYHLVLTRPSHFLLQVRTIYHGSRPDQKEKQKPIAMLMIK